MNELTLVNNQLPVRFEDLSKFVLIGREKLTSVRAEIRAIDKLELAKDVRAQKMEEAQWLGGALLDAEARIGTMLKAIPKKESYTGFQQRKAVLPDGITQKQSHFFQTLADNLDIVEQVKAEATENEDIPTRTEVLRRVKEKAKTEKRQKQDADIAKRSEYYIDDDVSLIEGDIFDVIEQVEDKSIDCLLTDPPYHVMNDYDWDKKDIDFLNSWIEVVKPKLKDKYTGFIFCDARMQYKFESVIREHFDIKNRIVWIRKNMSMGRVIGDRFISSYEIVFYFGNKDLNLPEVWGAERFDSFECAVPQSNFHEGKYHPTQKPLALIENLVSVGSYPGEVILDCFAGSGTTGLAVRNVGSRRCVLIEKEPEYCQTIRGRLSHG